jgi:hypothetical protein
MRPPGQYADKAGAAIFSDKQVNMLSGLEEEKERKVGLRANLIKSLIF